MSKPLKDTMAQALRKRYEGVDSACVVDLTGLNVAGTLRLRRELKANRMGLHVVKNAVARRALVDSPLQPLADRLTGPCALVVGEPAGVEIARVLVRLAKELKHIGLKEAIVEGDPELLPVAELSKMKGRTELLGEALMLVASPGRALAGCLSSPQSKIAGCLKARIDEGEKTDAAEAA